ncbi:MAG: serine protease [Pseudomonadota bacterium]
MQKSLRTLLSGLKALLVAFSIANPGAVQAQELTWIQIEARPTLALASERLRALAPTIDNLGGYQMRTGWYALALGPFSREVAEAQLAGLRGAARIPQDSYLTTRDAYIRQFWPVGQSSLDRPEPVTGTLAAAAPPAQITQTLPDTDLETPAEARAAERRLTGPEREEIQNALAWEGAYGGAIDGDFGPGTRRAMEFWQSNRALAVTGILTSAQRARLLGDYREAVRRLGMAPFEDNAAGISLMLPLGQVAKDRVDAPFSHFTSTSGDAPKVILISQPGDRQTLAALFEVLQTLEIVPLGGPRALTARSFEITGSDEKIVSHTFATLADDAIKGFTLVWPREDSATAERVRQTMRSSFQAIPGVTLSPAAFNPDQGVDLMAGLAVRRPLRSASGVFVDSAGSVLTALGPVAGCGRITIGDAFEVALASEAPALGLALLRPVADIAPPGTARFRAGPARIRSDIALAGFSYGGRLGAPTLTYGQVADLSGLTGQTAFDRLQILPETGDIGGPVLDASGAVVGILRPPPTENGKSLPPETRYSADSSAILAAFPDEDLAVFDDGDPTLLGPEDMRDLASDITVLVSCWE